MSLAGVRASHTPFRKINTMTLSEAINELKNNKVVRRTNSNKSYCFDANTKKFGIMIKYNMHEGVKYDIKYSEQDTISFYSDDFLADDWVVE